MNIADEIKRLQAIEKSVIDFLHANTRYEAARERVIKATTFTEYEPACIAAKATSKIKNEAYRAMIIAASGEVSSVGLVQEIEQTERSLSLARSYTPFSSEPCPLCETDAGRHVKSCAMHALLDQQSEIIASIARERDALLKTLQNITDETVEDIAEYHR